MRKLGLMAAAAALMFSASPAAAAQYVLTDLGDLPGGFDLSAALGVNDAGQVVGYSYVATGQRAFL